MKAWLFNSRDNCGSIYFVILVAIILLCMLCSLACGSIENPAAQNPAGVTTMPPSSIRSGLVGTPDPIDTSGNLVITGNVRGGSYFHGSVPYQSTTSFSASLGSSSLNSFLRDSSGSQDFGGYYGGYGLQPYYSQSQTVTTTAPGRSGVLRPSETRIDGRVGNGTLSTGADVFGLEPLPSGTTTNRNVGDIYTYNLNSQPQQIHPRSLTEPQSTSLSPQGTELLVTGEFDSQPQSEKSLSEQYRERLEQKRQKPDDTWDPELLLRNLQRVREQSARRNQMLTQESDSLQPLLPDRPTGTVQPENISRGQNEGVFGLKLPEGQTSRVPSVPYTPPVPVENAHSTQQDDFARRQSPGLGSEPQYSGADTVDTSRRDVLESMRRQLDELARSIENVSGEYSTQGAGDTELLTHRQMPDLRQPLRPYENQKTDMDQSISEFSNRPGSSGVVTNEDELDFPQEQSPDNSLNKPSALEELQGLSQAELSAEANRIMGPHKTLDSFSKAKFTEHYMAAKQYLRTGEYYRAANSFTLALMYKPDDPYSLAGKGYALFAAGEYISSALFISRALEIAPVYMQVNIDLADLLGADGNMLEGRIAEVEQWLARSGSAQLGFLLGYVCYWTGDLNRAKLAIESAYVKMPESTAILAVRTAVDKKLNIRQ
jgi:tetratricopeptide (TPR) repeat protein